jgi:predicted type IV restriction endonuclease
MDLPLPFPDRRGVNVQLIRTTEPPPNVSSVAEQYNGRTVYIYTNYDANDCVANAIHLLAELPSAQNQLAAAVTIA